MENQKFLKLRISEDLYDMFQDTCDSKNKNMSGVLRNFAKSYTESDNLVLLDLDDDTLKQTISLCKKKNIKFDELIKNLIETETINNK
jgi:hypothetical protein